MDGSGVLVFLRFFHGLGIISAGRSGFEPEARYVGFSFGRLPDIHAERDAGADQQFPHPGELVLGQCVHGIDNHSGDARWNLFVAEGQAPADDRVQEALRLARPGSRGDQRCLSGENRSERLFLMPVEAGIGMDLGHQGMQQALRNHLPDRRTFPEWSGQADVRAAQ